MCDVKEFCYSIFRHWKGICIVAFLSIILGVGGSLLSIITSGESELNEDSGHSWAGTEKIYVGKLKYVGISNEMIEGEEIRDIYLAKLLSDTFFDHIKINFFKDETDEYVKQIINISDGGLNTYFGIDIIYYDEEICKNIQEMIIDYLNEENSILERQIGFHKVLLVDSSVSEVDKSVYSEKISEIEREISQIPSSEETRSLSKKQLIMNILLSLVVGEFLFCVLILGRDGMKDKIYNANDLKGKTGVDLLGDFSSMSVKGRFNKIIYNIFIGKQRFSEEGIAKIIYYKLWNKFGKEKSYMVVGGCQEHILDKVVSNLMDVDKENLKISKGKLIDSSAEGIDNWNVKDKVVYVATRFKESKNDIEQHLKLFEELGFEIAGIIFV